jgi:hypothetical protein
MARKHNRVADALNFAASPRWRATVLWAAVAFAVCHGLAVATDSHGASLNGNLPLELVHFVAVLCRFLMPFGIMLAGSTALLASRWRRSASDIGPQSL